MAETSATASGSDDLVDWNYVNAVKSEFEDVYKGIGETLSTTNFAGYFDVLKSEDIVVKPEAAIALYKTLLVDELMKSFDRMWNVECIPQSLTVLEVMKDRYKDHTQPQWRPFGLSAKDQMLPLRVRILQKKIDYFEKQVKFQNKVLDVVAAQVTEQREAFAEYLRRRQLLSVQMDERTRSFPAIRKELTRLKMEAIKKL